MNETLWVGSILQFLAWITPIFLLSRVAFSLSPRFEKGFGIWQLFSAGGLVFLSVLFNTWWFLKLGRFSDMFVLAWHFVLLLAMFLVVSGGYVLLLRQKENEKALDRKVGKSTFAVFELVTVLMVTATVLYSIIKSISLYSFIDILAYNLGAGLLGSLYIVLGLFTRSVNVRKNNTRHYFAYIASVPIFIDSFLRSYILSNNAPASFVGESRFISSIAIGLSALLLYWSINSTARDLVLKIKGNFPEASFEHRKAGMQKRFAIAFSFMILFFGAAGILMLESMRSDEKIIETTYLEQQEKVAKSVTSNLSSLAEQLVGVVQNLADQPAVQRIEVPQMKKLFPPLLIKWGSIAEAFTRVDSNGVIRYTYPEVPGVIGRNISQQRHVKLLLERRETLISSPFRAVQGYYAIAIYVPVYAKNGRGEKAFTGGMAMLVKTEEFSIRAFRNVSILNSNPLAAVNMDSIVFSESSNSHIGETAEKYLSTVFQGRPKERTLKSIVQKVLSVSSPTFIPVNSELPYGMTNEWIVAVPIEIAGRHMGAMIVPIHSEEIVSLYRQGMSHQIRLWASLLAVLIAMVGVILVSFSRWSTFLESEVKRERDLVRETEGRYTKLVNDALVGIFEAKPDGELISANPALARILGYSSPSGLVGMKVLDEKDLREHSEGAPTQVGEGAAPYVKFTKIDGTPVYGRLSCRAVRGADGNVRYEGFIEDVTEQYLAHRRTEESEKRYSTLFKLSPAGIFVSTLDGKIIEVNDSFAKIYGYDSVEEVLPLAADVFYTDSSPRSQFLRDLKERGSVTHRVTEGKKKDGSTIFVIENTELNYDQNYNQEIIRGVLMDVTEIVLLQQQVDLHRRTAEVTSEVLASAFEETELEDFVNRSLASIGKKLRLDALMLFEIENGGIKNNYEWCADPSRTRGIITIDKKSFETSLAEVSGDSFFVLDKSQKNNENSPLMQTFGPQSFAISPVNLKGKVWGYLVLIDRDNNRVWSLLEKDLISSVSRIFSTVLERHSEAAVRRKLEDERKRLFLAFEQLAESVVVSNVDGIIQYVNPTFTKITGYTYEEAVGKRTNLLKSGAHDQEFYKRMWNTILSGNIFKARFTNKRKDGIIYYEDKTIAPVIDSNGRVVNFVEVGYDVTGQISLEEQLAQSQKLESIGLLASGIAHDFNNILGAILGYASFMKNKMSEDHQFYKYVDTIERSATRAAELTSQLLAFARGGKYNVTPVNINKMVLDTLGIIQSTFDKSIIVEKDLEQNIPTVEADPGQMQQVVMNLCVNARDAMPGGGILRVETSEVELTENDTKSNIEAHPGRYVLLIVSDTGIGMDKQTVRRIFEPFFTTKEKGKGTGLGLSMVYGIVRNHGGFIRVESEPGKGTSFEVFYPASRKAEKKEAGAMEEVKGGSETILVAEDEDAMRELVTDILESGGYNVIAAENGEAAVEAYTKRKDEISLVILDMIMPKMNGSEAFKNLKRINPDVLVLLSSGYSQDGAAQELLNEGVAGFLGKPYQVRELLEKVRAVLEKGKST